MEDSDGHVRLKAIKKIAIVGAGNAGITAAKYLLAEKTFERIDILEQSSHIGGLWRYTPESAVEDSFSIPQTTATAPLDTPIWKTITANEMANGPYTTSKKCGKEPIFISPLYYRLEANLPIDIMRHSDLEFPPDSQVFPTHECILDYLVRYADDVRHLIKFETQVQNISRVGGTGSPKWRVTTKNLQSSEETSTEYDAVLLASGHFNVPYVPDIPGIREWNESYPGSISHSKHFRKPEALANKKVISVGRGYSGLDIAMQLAPYTKPPLHISTYSPGAADSAGTYVQHPEIAELLPPSSGLTRAVRFINGHVETDIDHILFCTGYLYSFPFLPDFFQPPPSNANSSEDPSARPDDPPPIITDGARPHNLYKYIIYNAEPTLCVLSMPQQIVPFPIVESQSAVIARIWAGRLAVPPRVDMLEWEAEAVRSMGDGKKWLWLKAPLDGAYLNALAEWAESADAEGRTGKKPTKWGERELWIRARVLDIKKAFVALGEERRKVRTLEQLGFDFEAWKKAQPTGAAT